MQRRRAGQNSGSEQSAEHDGVIVWDREGVVIVWPDGHASRFPWTFLRSACPCDACHTRAPGHGEHELKEPMPGGSQARRSTYR